VAALAFVRDSEMFVSEEEQIVKPLRERIVEDVTQGIRFLLSSQQRTTENKMLGAVPERYPKTLSNAHGDGNVRIDYPQHSMSAVIAYERFVLDLERHKAEPRNGSFGSIPNHLRKLLPHRNGTSFSKTGNATEFSADGSFWANFILMGSIILILFFLVLNVFASPRKGRRQRRLKSK
jgi:hypothetical protein